MKTVVKGLNKELNKLRNRGAIGIGIFVRDGRCNIKDCAKEAVLFIKNMKKEKN